MSSKQHFWSFLKANVVSMITVFSGIGAVIAAQTGLLRPDQLPTITLGLVALLATSEIVEKSRNFDSIENLTSDGINRILDNLGSASVTAFHVAEEGFAYMGKCIESTTSEIQHAAFAPPIPRWPKESRTYEHAIETCLKSSKVRYRYLTDLSNRDARHERVCRLLSDPTITTYFVKSLPSLPKTFPGFSFMVFDKTEVVVYYPYFRGELETVLAIRHPEIVASYMEYFRRLWIDGEEIDLSKANQLINS